MPPGGVCGWLRNASSAKWPVLDNSPRVTVCRLLLYRDFSITVLDTDEKSTNAREGCIRAACAITQRDRIGRKQKRCGSWLLRRIILFVGTLLV